MVSNVLLGAIWTGVNGVRYTFPPRSSELAHLLIGTLNRDNSDHLEVGEEFMQRWRADDRSQGHFKVVDVGVGDSLILEVDVCPILPVGAAFGHQEEGSPASALTGSVLLGSSDPKSVSLARQQAYWDCNSADKPARIPAVGQPETVQGSLPDDPAAFELIIVPSQTPPSTSPVVGQPSRHSHTMGNHEQEYNYGTLRKKLFSCFCFQR